MLQLFLKIVYGTIINTLFFMKITCYDPSIYLYNRLTLSKLNLVSFYENKVIIITGASSGIGKALALLLYSYGANLILTARNKEMLELVANQCFQAYPNQCGKILIIPFDIENYSNIDEFVTTLKEKIAKNKLDHVDMILNNAGVSSRGTAIETSLDTLHSVMAINFYGPVALTQGVIPLMSVSTRRKKIIAVVSSVQGKIGIPNRTSYAASKHAVQGYFDGLRAELANKNFQVTVISPGYVNTSLSINAVTATGLKYGKTDETTAKGMNPADIANEIANAIYNGESDIVIADAKTTAGIYLKALLPELFAKFMKSRA